MCQGDLCACNEQGCTADPRLTLDFDVALNANADGAQGDFDGSTVVFTKN
jgi:hypothetical protein